MIDCNTMTAFVELSLENIQSKWKVPFRSCAFNCISASSNKLIKYSELFLASLVTFIYNEFTTRTRPVINSG